MLFLRHWNSATLFCGALRITGALDTRGHSRKLSSCDDAHTREHWWWGNPHCTGRRALSLRTASDDDGSPLAGGG